jgi:hypothetical protein
VDENTRTECRAKKKANSKPLDSSPRSMSPNSDTTISKELDLSAFQEHIHISFLLKNLLSGASKPSPWLALHAEDPSPCAQMSIRALGAVYFGRMHRNEVITTRSFGYYTSALRSLNENLENHENAASMTVLNSAINLELYEVSISSSCLDDNSQIVPVYCF